MNQTKATPNEPAVDINADLFGKDNFTQRRTSGHNMYDPESLITGKESSEGMTYLNSRRVFPSVDAEFDAIEGKMGVDEILKAAPRQLVAV